MFFFSSRRRHTICALVTGVQTCALPIWPASAAPNTAVPALACSGVEAASACAESGMIPNIVPANRSVANLIVIFPPRPERDGNLVTRRLGSLQAAGPDRKIGRAHV